MSSYDNWKANGPDNYWVWDRSGEDEADDDDRDDAYDRLDAGEIELRLAMARAAEDHRAVVHDSELPLADLYAAYDERSAMLRAEDHHESQ